MVKLQKNINLKSLSTFKIGGRARFFCEIKNNSEFFAAINLANKFKVSYKVIGGGSNAVFPDWFDGLIIKIKTSRIKIFNNKIIVDAGVNLSAAVEKSIIIGLRGLETLSGIPGTIGGAIAGNAGAYGHSISELVEKVKVFDGKNIGWLKNKDCGFYYRESVFKARRWIILRAVLILKKGDREKLERISNDIIERRRKKYGLNLSCPGSFFKNILVSEVNEEAFMLIDKNRIIEGKIPAGYLLEQVGAKGLRRGGVKVADFHGNFFINNGRATMEDVKELAAFLRRRVKSRFGIELEEEVRYF